MVAVPGFRARCNELRCPGAGHLRAPNVTLKRSLAALELLSQHHRSLYQRELRTCLSCSLTFHYHRPITEFQPWYCRLRRAGSAWNETFGYDGFGNLTSKSGYGVPPLGVGYDVNNPVTSTWQSAMGIKTYSRSCGAATCAVLALYSTACQGNRGKYSLAVSLANDSTRQAAITSIVTSGRDKIPLLLSWTKHPPKGVAECGLRTGLEEAFGRLKTKEAIPFLLENISESRGCFGTDLAPWLKDPDVIEWQLPAVGALIKIGPDASMAAMSAFPNMTDEEKRRAAIFVVSRIKHVSEAEPFLRTVSDRADREHYWAEQCIRLKRQVQ